MTDPDFTLAGKSLLEWLGEEPHESTIKAAEQALAVPGEPFIVAVFRDPALPWSRFAEGQRRAARIWFSNQDQPGRIRLNTRQRLEPGTGQDVRVVTVIYEPKAKPKAVKTDA